MSFESEIIEQRLTLKCYAIKLLGSQYYLAEDFVQDTLIKALSNKGQYKPDTNLKAWLMTILRNEVFNYFRRSKYAYLQSQTREDASTIDVPVRPDQEITIQWKEFEKVFETLSEVHKRSIKLIFIDGLSYEEAAAIEKVPEGTVKSRVSRARMLLRKMFELPDQDVISIGVIGNEDNRRSREY